MKKKVKKRILHGFAILVFLLFIIVGLLIRNESNNRKETEKTMQRVEANLHEAIDITYNQKDLENKDERISSLVGNDLAKKLDEVTRPSISQSGTNTKRIEKSEKIVVKIGELNQSDDTFPIKVSVYYQTPPIKLNSDVSHYQGKKELILHGKTGFKLKYLMDKEQLVVDSYKDEIIEFPVDDYKMGLVDVKPLNQDQRFLEIPKEYKGKLKYQLSLTGLIETNLTLIQSMNQLGMFIIAVCS